MLWTPVRSSGIAQSIQKLLPNKLPPSLVPRTGNLYEVLSRSPGGGVGTKVHQIRWSEKQIGDSYWVVTRSRFKCEGKHGKAWGLLYWKNKLVSPREERIRGSLKYTWAEGRSVAKNAPNS
ncbi:putative mitochondrial 28S ribosomal protein S34 [Lyophyllum shimeji]|uniref:Mitochondrial 28S ribosomal protein S34 n=1 Tax=Lyophyllum shimeji TaxID=47721 RepID=A0A9P3PCN4_LYOSH|nr:putative mitochondrial 28S ribosomal protein S34 [Lyophyllum shimeji]